MVSILTWFAVKPCSKLTSAANSSVQTLVDFPACARTLVQQSSQGFTFSLVKLGLYRLWSGGLLLEALDAFLFKRMDGITDGLRGTAQILSDDFGALFSTGG
jgi:hypothetical protein